MLSALRSSGVRETKTSLTEAGPLFGTNAVPLQPILSGVGGRLFDRDRHLDGSQKGYRMLQCLAGNRLGIHAHMPVAGCLDQLQIVQLSGRKSDVDADISLDCVLRTTRKKQAGERR